MLLSRYKDIVVERLVEDSIDVDAFLVRKRELSKTGHRYFDSYQRRLYKRETALYSGLVFFDPEIKGTERKLSTKYYLNHHFEYYENLAKGTDRYFVIAAHEARKTYGDIVEMLKNRQISKRFAEHYIKKNGEKFEDELTKEDYKFLHCTVQYLFGDILYYIKRGKMPNPNFTVHNYFYLLREIDSFFRYTPEERKEQLQITQEIRAEKGVINYLRVDEDRINFWRQKYDSEEVNWVKVFTSLLREEYQRRMVQVNTPKSRMIIN